MTVKPWVVVLAIVIFGAPLAGIFWAGAQERAQQGPSLLRVDQQGDLYVVFNENIFRLSPEGQYKNTYRLRDLGVGEMIGGMDFFRNGDVLLRSGESLPGLFDQILIQLRIRQSESSADNPGDRLVRCNLDSRSCKPLAGFDETFKRTFRIAIDAADNIFIADTGREALYWLNASGQKIAEVRSGLRLPNQLMRDGDRIVVTNTNHNELTFIPLTNTGFEPDSKWQHLKVNTPEARQTRETWPMDLLKVGEDWLVLSQGSNMAFGDVFRFAEDGSLHSRFDLRDEVDPLAIAKLGDDVIVADYAGLRLLRYSDKGEPRGELIVPKLTEYAEGVRVARDRFALYQTVLWSLFAVALVTGFAVAIVSELRVQRERRAIETARKAHIKSQPVRSSPRPTTDDPDIYWIGLAKSTRRRVFATLILFGAVWILMVITIAFLSLKKVPDSSFLILYGPALVGPIALASLVTFFRIFFANTRIGILREWVIVRDWRKRIAIGRGNEIILMPNAIAIEGVSLRLGHKYLMMFSEDEWAKWVEPRLSETQKLNKIEMLKWSWKYQRIHILAALAAIVAMLTWTSMR